MLWQILGLDICSETMLGNEMVRGVSGGQKKRVTTGQSHPLPGSAVQQSCFSPPPLPTPLQPPSLARDGALGSRLQAVLRFKGARPGTCHWCTLGVPGP